MWAACYHHFSVSHFNQLSHDTWSHDDQLAAVHVNPGCSQQVTTQAHFALLIEVYKFKMQPRLKEAKAEKHFFFFLQIFFPSFFGGSQIWCLFHHAGLLIIPWSCNIFKIISKNDKDSLPPTFLINLYCDKQWKLLKAAPSLKRIQDSPVVRQQAEFPSTYWKWKSKHKTGPCS